MLGTPHFGVEISDWSLSRLSSAQDTKISITCRSVRGFRRELAKLVMRVDFGLCIRRVIIPALSVLYEVKKRTILGLQQRMLLHWKTHRTSDCGSNYCDHYSDHQHYRYLHCLECFVRSLQTSSQRRTGTPRMKVIRDIATQQPTAIAITVMPLLIQRNLSASAPPSR